MSNKMTLEKAIRQMKPGDEIKSGLYGKMMNANNELVCPNDKNTYSPLTLDDFDRGWEIIRAELEVWTAEKLHQFACRDFGFMGNWGAKEHIDNINRADKNGQNREWKRMKPLRDRIETRIKFYDSEREPNQFVHDLQKLLNELKPPWEIDEC